MKNEEQNFCANMKWLRQKYNYSKKEMAKICNTGAKSISMIEKGIIPKRLSADIVFDVQKHFGVLPENMFGRKFCDCDKRE